MEKKMIPCPDINIESQDNESFKNYFKEHVMNLALYFRQKDYDQLQVEVDKQIKSVFYQRKKYGENLVFLFGRYVGILEALDEFLLEQKEKNKLYRLVDGSKPEDIPHSDDIIRTIFKEEGIRHGKLAERTGIEKSTLTPIMDKLVSHGLVSFERPGKFKYYYLTPVGEDYYQEKLVKYEKNLDLDYLIEALLIKVSTDCDPTLAAQKVTNAIIASQYKFKGYNSDTPKRVRPSHLITSLMNKYDGRLYIDIYGKNVPVNHADTYTLHEKSKDYIDFLRLSDVNKELIDEVKEA